MSVFQRGSDLVVTAEVRRRFLVRRGSPPCLGGCVTPDQIIGCPALENMMSSTRQFVRRISEMQKKQLTEGKTMRTKITAVCATLLLATAVWSNADQPEKQRQASPEFERMKTLVGSWKGKTDMGQGLIDLTVQYRLLAGGSVLEERVFAGNWP
jgi:hypothetical protein